MRVYLELVDLWWLWKLWCGIGEVHIELSVSTPHNERLETKLSFLRPIGRIGSISVVKFKKGIYRIF